MQYLAFLLMAFVCYLFCGMLPEAYRRYKDYPTAPTPPPAGREVYAFLVFVLCVLIVLSGACAVWMGVHL